VLVGADGDWRVAGGEGDGSGGGGGAEVHCTSAAATVAIAATVRSRVNAPTGAKSILRLFIRKTAVMGGFAGYVSAIHGTRGIRIARL
jgi:hypothetical protein